MNEKIIAIVEYLKKQALKINVPFHLLPSEKVQDDGGPHLAILENGDYALIYTERGRVNKKKTSKKLETIAYWVFDDITFGMACSYELQHRKENVDCRRMIFDKQAELMTTIENEWGIQIRARHQEVLAKSPFDDWSDARVFYCVELRKKGFSETDIWNKACEKYPLP